MFDAGPIPGFTPIASYFVLGTSTQFTSFYLFLCYLLLLSFLFFFFFFNDPAPPEISPFPLHAALPIFRHRVRNHRDDYPAPDSCCGNRRNRHSGDRRCDAGHAERCRDSASSGLDRGSDRSEEHTSELQSPDHLVCRLLLEKKKKQNVKK